MSNHRLEVENLTVSYNRVPAIHHIEFATSCGHCVALMGPNGAGKTTLLKTLAGLLRAETGGIQFHGHPVKGPNTHFAYLPQRENIDWDFPITVRGLVEMGRYLRVGWSGKYRAQDDAAVQSAINQMRLNDLEKRQISALSGGQQQRAFLARSIAQEAHVFLLDEPFTGLDEPTRDALAATLRQLSGSGKLIIASHHDLATVSAIFSEVLLLNGELIASGPPADVLTTENVHRTYTTLAFSGKKSHA